MVQISGVCSYFNPCGYQARRRNYDLFRRHVEDSGMSLLTIELLFQNQPHSELGTASDVLTLRGGDIMWQKERLLQFGIERLLTDGADIIVWLDADIIFRERHWKENILRSLDRFDCVQSFETIISQYTRRDCVMASKVKNPRSPASGGSWAATREYWQNVPLYQHCIVGGGDAVMAATFIEFRRETPFNWAWEFEDPRIQRLGPKMQRHFLAWAKSIWRNWRIGYVRNQTAHLMKHGALKRRRYHDRHELLLDCFDPDQDIAIAPSGAWKWNTPKPELHTAVAAYFSQRREDG